MARLIPRRLQRRARRHIRGALRGSKTHGLGEVCDVFAPRWPFGTTQTQRVDSLQSKILAAATGIPSAPGEERDTFLRRRARDAGQRARALGAWSTRMARRVLMWEAHRVRGHVPQSWATALCEVQDAAWLRQHRLAMGSASEAGRKGTRLAPGRPPPRWHDFVEWASRQGAG